MQTSCDYYWRALVYTEINVSIRLCCKKKKKKTVLKKALQLDPVPSIVLETLRLVAPMLPICAVYLP